MPNIYGPHIKAVREQKGIKARYVAARLRVSPPTYSEIESGQRGLSAERLRVIVRALEITLEDIDRLVYAGAEQASKAKPGYGREGKLRAV